MSEEVGLENMEKSDSVYAAKNSSKSFLDTW